MLVTDWTKSTLAYRKAYKALSAKGYEYVGEGGGKLWELARGYRAFGNYQIVDAKILPGGQALMVKIENLSK